MSFNDKHRTRLLFFQSLYQMQVLGKSEISDIVSQFSKDNEGKSYCEQFLEELLNNYAAYKSQVDNVIIDILQKKTIDEVSPVELSICRLGVYELILMPETPYKVIITEALKIQKKYGVDEGYKFVNGVLDKASKRIRANEV